MERALLAVSLVLLVSCSGSPGRPPEHVAARDTDGDGIADDVDRCPDEPEDEDGFRDEDGCDDADDDGDGIADRDDRCPCVAEDRDGWEDTDGCPDLDNDGDRILDACDACPNEPEVYNGCEDEDGCPDRSGVVIEDTRIVIVEHVFFTRGSSEIQPRSLPVLEAIAATIVGNPQITRVRVDGHADRGEPRAERLARARAEAVRDWLIAHGVAASRLEAVGFGTERPIVDPRDRTHERNRRVELTILEIEGMAIDPDAPPPLPRPPRSCVSSWRSGCEEHPPEPPRDVCAEEAAR